MMFSARAGDQIRKTVRRELNRACHEVKKSQVSDLWEMTSLPSQLQGASLTHEWKGKQKERAPPEFSKDGDMCFVFEEGERVTPFLVRLSRSFPFPVTDYLHGTQDEVDLIEEQLHGSQRDDVRLELVYFDFLLEK